MIEIDGSFGEGGGQLLRGAVALSCLTGEVLRVHSIRGRRPKPGLQAQHLESIRAAAAVSGAEAEGLKMGSTELTFRPSSIRGGAYSIDIKTAGSVTLVIQTLLPILAFADSPSEVRIAGGTDVNWSPPIDYMRYVALPNLQLMGIESAIELLRRGHFPRGGGEAILRVKPVRMLKPLRAVERGRVERIRGISHCTNLPPHVASRQAAAAMKILKGYSNVRITDEANRGAGPGSGIVLWAETAGGTKIGGDALGARERRAEEVGAEAAEKLLSELQKGMAVDSHMADMLILYASLAPGTSELGASSLTLHSETMIWLSSRIIGAEWTVRRAPNGSAVIRTEGIGLINSRLP